MKYIPIIIILILILIIIYAIYYGYCHITYSIRSFISSLFGTSDLRTAAREMRNEYSSTPKSISAMTTLCLPRIEKDFPGFNYDEMVSRAENVLVGYFRAISENNLGVLTDCNLELSSKLDNYIAALDARGQHECYDNVLIHRTEIGEYKNNAGRCVITFQSAVEFYRYTVNNTGEVVDGSKDYKCQTRYNVDMVYIQDRDIVENEGDLGLGLNCPNCGAVISNLGHKHCEYCGSNVEEFNIRVWSFSDVEEV